MEGNQGLNSYYKSVVGLMFVTILCLILVSCHHRYSSPDVSAVHLDQFVSESLQPYLQGRFQGVAFNYPKEKGIRQEFRAWFAPDSNRNPINYVFRSLEKWDLYQEVDHTGWDQLNDLMVDKGYYLHIDIQEKDIAVFRVSEIMADSLVWKSGKKFQVLKLQSLDGQHPELWGYSNSRENVVVVLEEGIEKSIDKLNQEIRDPNYKYYQSNHNIQLWNSIQLPLNLAEANNIRRDVLRRDFQDSIHTQSLHLTTAIHEAKHKFDEGSFSDSRDRGDNTYTHSLNQLELSAYYSQISLSPYPHFSLIQTITWLESKWWHEPENWMLAELKFLWSVALASKSLDKQETSTWIPAVLGKRYEGWASHYAGLPDLGEFEGVIREGLL